MEETHQVVQPDEIEILVFLKEFVKKKLEQKLFPCEISDSITKEGEIEIRIPDPIFTGEDVLLLKSLERLFKIEYFEFIPIREPDKKYFLMIMKPKKSAIKTAKKILNIGGI
jgi:hypothetical protein